MDDVGSSVCTGGVPRGGVYRVVQGSIEQGREGYLGRVASFRTQDSSSATRILPPRTPLLDPLLDPPSDRNPHETP